MYYIGQNKHKHVRVPHTRKQVKLYKLCEVLLCRTTEMLICIVREVDFYYRDHHRLCNLT